jgi:hypothetical protein
VKKLLLAFLSVLLGLGFSGVAAISAQSLSPRTVSALYFYWYDAQSGGHLQPETLRTHFVTPPDWHQVGWHEQQFRDMIDAGIDVALPNYWGYHPNAYDAWTYEALPIMAQANRNLTNQGLHPPKIGMFFDTSATGMADLRTWQSIGAWERQMYDFYSRIPRDQWALVQGRPVVYLFTSDTTGAMNQWTFDLASALFQSQFGVRPWIVREESWDYPILGWSNGERVRDYAHPIRTDDKYVWGGGIHGFTDSGTVAAIGPGFDVYGLLVPRLDGNWYMYNWYRALVSTRRAVFIESWNEAHEGTGIAEFQEFGRFYIYLTRLAADQFHGMP